MSHTILTVLSLTAVGVIAACQATPNQQQAAYHAQYYSPGYNQYYCQDPNDGRWYYYGDNNQRVCQNARYQFAPPTTHEDNTSH